MIVLILEFACLPQTPFFYGKSLFVAYLAIFLNNNFFESKKVMELGLMEESYLRALNLEEMKIKLIS